MSAPDITLLRQTSDMRAHGFVIQTNHGNLTIPPGNLAEFVSKLVYWGLQAEFDRLERGGQP